MALEVIAMTITQSQFLQSISASKADVFVLHCTDLVVYDSGAGIVYVPQSTFESTTLNPMGDFRTHLGHCLQWSGHAVVEGASVDMYNALVTAGYTGELYEAARDYAVYRLKKQAAANAQ
jgi:hypothetical protein